MPKPYIISGLDVGSGSIKLLSILKRPGEPDFQVLGKAQQVSFGIRKGVIVDAAKVAGIISALANKVEEDCGQPVRGAVYANVGGAHLFSTPSRGLVSVSRADQKISREDITRVLQAAQTISLSSNKEVIEVFPKEFIVDGERGIKDALGLEGVRLEAEVLVLGGFSPYLKNSNQTISNSGLQLNYLVPNPLASSRAVLSPREKELGVALLDIGAGTSSLAVFEEGSLIHFSIFPVGSGHITNDLAICLKTDIDIAEKVKLEFGSCHPSFFGKQRPKKAEKKVRIEGEEPLIFSRKMLADIIEARVSEIFDLVGRELKKISRQNLLPAGVVLTGGGSNLPGIKELARKELKLSSRVGMPQGFSVFEKEPELAALYGLILEGIDDMEGEEGSPSLDKEGIGAKVKKIFRVFIP